MTTTEANPVANDSQVVHTVAKLLWFVPALLLFLTINQLLVAVDISDTLDKGMPAIATVTDYERVDRKDVTFGYVSLTVELEDGSTLVKEKMSLPYTLLPALEGESELPVLVMPGAHQEIVIQSIASTQWKIAAFQSLMALIALLISTVGVFKWNTYLKAQTSN